MAWMCLAVDDSAFLLVDKVVVLVTSGMLSSGRCVRC